MRSRSGARFSIYARSMCPLAIVAAGTQCRGIRMIWFKFSLSSCLRIQSACPSDTSFRARALVTRCWQVHSKNFPSLREDDEHLWTNTALKDIARLQLPLPRVTPRYWAALTPRGAQSRSHRNRNYFSMEERWGDSGEADKLTPFRLSFSESVAPSAR